MRSHCTQRHGNYRDTQKHRLTCTCTPCPPGVASGELPHSITRQGLRETSADQQGAQQDPVLAFVCPALCCSAWSWRQVTFRGGMFGGRQVTALPLGSKPGCRCRNESNFQGGFWDGLRASGMGKRALQTHWGWTRKPSISARTVTWRSLWVKHWIPHVIQQFHSSIYTPNNWKQVPKQKFVYECYSHIICCIIKVETTQLSVNKWIYKQNVVCGILFGHEQEYGYLS
jgi:hypothetical protein